MKIKIITCCSFLFFLYLFVVSSADFHGPDEPIYFAYTASIVEDGDLNVINQNYLQSGQSTISKTYNFPDFHNHGGVILWAPFYSYAKAVDFLAAKFNLRSLVICGLDKLINCAMSFSTIIFGFFTFLLSYLLCRVFFSKKIALWSTLAIFFGTPFFYYMLFEPGNANIVASLLSIISIWFCAYVIGMKKSHWFLYGVFFSICIVIKLDLWFQIFFIAFCFMALLILKQTTWKNGMFFFAGLVPGLILKVINDYIKYGTFHIGEVGLLNFKDFYFFEQLFSRYRGFFYTSPVFYICLLGFVFLIINLLRGDRFTNDKEKKQDLFFLILSSYLFIKLFISAFRYAWGGGNCGARQLLTEFPIFVLLYARTLQNRRRYITCLIGGVSLFFIFWNLLVISEYIAMVDLNYIAGAPPLNIRVETLKHILYSLFYIKDLGLKLKLCLPLILAIFGITFFIKIKFTKTIYPSFWYIKTQIKPKLFKIFALLTIYMFSAYTIITALNVSSNKRNVEKLKKEGFFENVQIIEARDFEKQENVGSMYEMIEYFKLKGNLRMINKIKLRLKEVYNEQG